MRRPGPRRLPALILLLSGPGGLAVTALATPPGVAIETSLYLVGDAGRPDPDGEPVLIALSRDLGQAPGSPFVVFLGDNVYHNGVPEPGAPDRAGAELALAAQVAAVRDAGARGLFIPGNHDWDDAGPEGWKAIVRQAELAIAGGAGALDFQPRGGCPGPETVDLGARLRLIVLDTQWWLHPGPKPGAGSSCPATDPASVTRQLQEQIAGAQGREVVVVGHHPLASSGEHAGRFTWQEHLFPLRHLKRWLWLPLPVLGSLHPIARDLGISAQDRSGGANKRMRGALEAAMRPDPPLVYAAGHEHGLEVHHGRSARHLLVSGGGYYGHVSPLFPDSRTRAAFSASGFMRLDVGEDGCVLLSVLGVDAEGNARVLLRDFL